MQHIVIISSSVREGRKSHGVSLYFKNYLSQNDLATAEILDLKAYKFPLFESTLKEDKHPSGQSVEFAGKVKAADGIIIVTPEYNGGYPASLKNIIDLLYDEWQNKPISICTVSAGIFGGSQVLVSLQFTLWKIGALVVTNMFYVPNVATSYDEKGNTLDKPGSDKLAGAFVKELLETCKLSKQLPIMAK